MQRSQLFNKSNCNYRQTSVSLQPYNVEIHIDSSRFITETVCTCIYNKSGKCKHIAAVIHFINTEESCTKTDHEQQWGRPSARQYAHEKYSKGKFFFEMFTPKKEVSVQGAICDPSQLKQSSAFQVLMLESKKDEAERISKSIVNCLLKKVDVILEKQECEECLAVFFSNVSNFKLYKNNYNVSKDDEQFYLKHIVLKRQEIIDLCCATLNQAQCDQWFEARYLRLSASEKIHKIKIRKRKTEESLIKDFLNPCKLKTTSTEHGKRYECIARQQYEQYFNVKVYKLGVLVSESQPWLCASLDGAIIENKMLIKIIETKCPFSCINKPIVDLNLKKSNVKYLHFQKDCLVLKQSSQYYTQCQIQMYLARLSICDLFVYSPYPNGSICVAVERNEKFLRQAICKSEDFYFNSFLKQLRITKGHEKSNERSFSGVSIDNMQ